MEVSIRKPRLSDSSQLAAIYNHYILNTTTSFEVEEITIEEMKQRMFDISQEFPYFVAVNKEGKIVGYCHAKPFGKTVGYQFSVEVTIYLSPYVKQKGIGTLLYDALEKSLKLQGIKTMIASVTAELIESVNFHKKKGFIEVAHLKNIGYKFDCWLDVIWLQKSF